MRNFLRKKTPDLETFHRQLSRSFGIQLPDFRIKVHDTVSDRKFTVGELGVDIDEETKITINKRPVVLPDDTELPVKGYVAYAKNPYKTRRLLELEFTHVVN